MKNLFVIALSLLFLPTIPAGAAKPIVINNVNDIFNIKWGAKQSDFAGIQRCEVDGNFTGCFIVKQPTNYFEAKVYILEFYKNKGLQKIIFESKHITNDYGGVTGRKIFETTYGRIARKFPYAKKHVIKYVKPDTPKLEFYKCLQDEQCSTYLGTIEHETGNIYIELLPEHLARGVILVERESPNYDDFE